MIAAIQPEQLNVVLNPMFAKKILRNDNGRVNMGVIDGWVKCESFELAGCGALEDAQNVFYEDSIAFNRVFSITSEVETGTRLVVFSIGAISLPHY